MDTRSIGYATPMDVRIGVSAPRVRRTTGVGSGIGVIPSAGSGGNSGVTAPVDWGGIVTGIGDWLGDRLDNRRSGGGASQTGEQICAGRGLTFNYATGTCNELVASGGGAGCPPGKVEIFGQCLDPGAALPGGDPFITPASGASGIGPLGLYASPMVVGEINGNPIRRCPRGLVLARDEQCYDKRALPNRFRKHPKRRKAKISAYDWKMMNRYGPGGSKQEKAKQFAQAAGYAVSHTAKSKPKKKGKKK